MHGQQNIKKYTQCYSLTKHGGIQIMIVVDIQETILGKQAQDFDVGTKYRFRSAT